MIQNLSQQDSGCVSVHLISCEQRPLHPGERCPPRPAGSGATEAGARAVA
jgi:hypothetical protein